MGAARCCNTDNVNEGDGWISLPVFVRVLIVVVLPGSDFGAGAMNAVIPMASMERPTAGRDRIVPRTSGVPRHGMVLFGLPFFRWGCRFFLAFFPSLSLSLFLSREEKTKENTLSSRRLVGDSLSHRGWRVVVALPPCRNESTNTSQCHSEDVSE